MMNSTQEPPERTVEEQLATPALARFVGRHPAIRVAVTEVLEAANEVRRTRTVALPRASAPVRSAEWRRAEKEMGIAVAELERVSAAPDPLPGEVLGVTRRVMLTVMDLRVQNHAFSPPRAVGGRAERAALVQALRRFTGVLDRLRQRARPLGVTRLPWQIEFATHRSLPYRGAIDAC